MHGGTGAQADNLECLDCVLQVAAVRLASTAAVVERRKDERRQPQVRQHKGERQHVSVIRLNDR